MTLFDLTHGSFVASSIAKNGRLFSRTVIIMIIIISSEVSFVLLLLSVSRMNGSVLEICSFYLHLLIL